MACYLPKRVILGIMAFFMFFITQMIRSNLYIAIVAMVDYKNTTLPELNSSIYKLHWDENYVGILLSSFYWCYWITELPGGILAQQYGGRRILGVSVLIAGFSNFIFPASAKFHPILASVVRATQGLALGVTWPAMHSLSAKWIPRTERSKFMTTYQGAAVGSALTYPICGILIASYGWECVFYLTGTLTVIWSIIWWYCVYDTPQQHPNITKREQDYLDNEFVDYKINIKKLKTPWSSIVSSGPFWAVLIASQGVIWGTITISMQMPSYFSQIHNLDIKINGLLLGIPDFVKFFFGLLFSSFLDYLLKSGKLQITTVRKIAVGTSEIGPAIFMLALCYWGAKNYIIAIALVTILISFSGACASGNLANIVDIAPNFAGVTLGLVKTLCVLPGVISPIVVSAIVFKENHSNDEWCWVFIITASIQIVTSIVFFVFGTGEVQIWNQPQDKKQFDNSDSNQVELNVLITHPVNNTKSN